MATVADKRRPVALDGVDAVVGTITRDDGTVQVTVNDFPAYYYRDDAANGDTLGNGRGSVWWVFNADGSPQRPAKVGLAENAGLGNILTDGAGRSLCIFVTWPQDRYHRLSRFSD